MLVLAGPGTGKTEVLTRKIAYLVGHKIAEPNEILAVTFTNKAAGEMRDRLQNFISRKTIQKIWISTIHSAGCSILRKNGELTGLGSNFNIADATETQMLLNDASYDIAVMLRQSFNELKARTHEVAKEKANGKLSDEVKNSQLRALYARYQELLKFHRAVDFHDLVIEPVRFLSSNTEILKRYRSKSKFLLVDEYQDVNHAENRFIRLLAGDGCGLFVVGDDDQSIYGSWRFADTGIILNFEKDFENGISKPLDICFRSGEHIIQGALGLISHNDPNRKPKEIRCKHNDELIRVVKSAGYAREANWIAGYIEKRLIKGYRPSQFLVVAEQWDYMNRLAQELETRKIPILRRISSWLKAKSVGDILACLRLIVEPDSNLALRRCLEILGHGIGIKGIQTIRSIAIRKEISLWEVVKNSHHFRKLNRWQSSLLKFVNYLSDLEKEAKRKGIQKFIRFLAREMDNLEEPGVPEFLEYVRLLPPALTIEDLLQDIEKKRNRELEEGAVTADESEGCVALMTIHGAKGLGAYIVFVIGMEDGMFPNPTRDLHEQRRLAYVAMTRAEKRLFLCYSHIRRGRAGGNIPSYEPSIFLSEIPRKHIKELNLTGREWERAGNERVEE